MIQYNKEAYPNHTPEMFRDMVGLVGRWLEEYSRNSLGNMLKVMLADEEREIAELLGFIAEESEEEEEEQ